MGGTGSTRWKDHQRAPVVEDALQLDAAAFETVLKQNQKTGSLRWTNPKTEEATAEFIFSLGPVSEAGTRRLVIEPPPARGGSSRFNCSGPSWVGTRDGYSSAPRTADGESESSTQSLDG